MEDTSSPYFKIYNVLPWINFVPKVNSARAIKSIQFHLLYRLHPMLCLDLNGKMSSTYLSNIKQLLRNTFMHMLSC